MSYTKTIMYGDNLEIYEYEHLPPPHKRGKRKKNRAIFKDHGIGATAGKSVKIIQALAIDETAQLPWDSP